MKVINKIAQVGVAGVLATLLATGAQAQLSSVMYMDEIALQTTNWNDTVTIPLFDPSLGVLEQICFTLKGSIVSDFQLESLDAEPAHLTATASGNITLTRPDNSLLVAVLPEQNVEVDVDAFDGTVDFGGTSGVTLPGVMGMAEETFISPPPVSDLALFTGLGTIDLNVSAEALSTASGAGNLITLIQTQAGAKVTVEYKYRPRNNDVPEPGSVAMLVAGGVMGVGLLRRRASRK